MLWRFVWEWAPWLQDRKLLHFLANPNLYCRSIQNVSVPFLYRDRKYRQEVIRVGTSREHKVGRAWEEQNWKKGTASNFSIHELYVAYSRIGGGREKKVESWLRQENDASIVDDDAANECGNDGDGPVRTASSRIAFCNPLLKLRRACPRWSIVNELHTKR